MNPITAIHVDDDPRSLENFKQLAVKIPGLILKAGFNNAIAALKYVENNKIDILFSDIVMPGHDGLWLAEQLLHKQLDVVFVSSHTEYAIHAFEACALDYLVKPVQLQKLESLLERYHLRKNKGVAEQVRELFKNYMEPASYPKRIFVNTVGELKMVQLNEVVYFSATGSYTNIYFKNGEMLTTSKLIKTYVDALQHHPDFVRIHRSFLINKQHVTHLKRDSAKYSVNMSNGDQLEISRQRMEDIFEVLTKE